MIVESPVQELYRHCFKLEQTDVMWGAQERLEEGSTP